MNYCIQKELKDRIKQAGVDIRDLANHLQEPPGTLSNRLNGWIPLPVKIRNAIEDFIKQKETKNKE